MVSININQHYLVDGLTEEEVKELKKAVDCINSFLATKNDKMTVSKSGFRTMIQLEINSIKLAEE